MSHEAYCEDFFVGADEKVIKLIEQICLWKTKNLMLYPNDVLNMLIDCNLVNMVEVEQILEASKKKDVDITLPTRYISE